MLMLGQEGSALVMSIPDMTREQLLRGTASLTSGFLHCNRLIIVFYIVSCHWLIIDFYIVTGKLEISTL